MANLQTIIQGTLKESDIEKTKEYIITMLLCNRSKGSYNDALTDKTIRGCYEEAYFEYCIQYAKSKDCGTLYKIEKDVLFLPYDSLNAVSRKWIRDYCFEIYKTIIRRDSIDKNKMIENLYNDFLIQKSSESRLKYIKASKK